MDANELLEDLRTLSSQMIDQLREADAIDTIRFEYDVDRMARTFVKLDIAILEGKVPDSWSGAKLSKTKVDR